jgi:hypothetical protein
MTIFPFNQFDTPSSPSIRQHREGVERFAGALEHVAPHAAARADPPPFSHQAPFAEERRLD